MAGIAICQLCAASSNFRFAEAEYGQGLLTNLVAHFNIMRPGHKEALDEIERSSHMNVKTGSAAAATAARGFASYYYPEGGASLA